MEKIIVRPFVNVEIEDSSGEKVEVRALVDTGARMSSIDVQLAKKIGVYDEDKVLYEGSYSSALGKQKRPVVAVTFYLKGKRVVTKANVADRSMRQQAFLVGRRDLVGFLVEVLNEDETYQGK